MKIEFSPRQVLCLLLLVLTLIAAIAIGILRYDFPGDKIISVNAKALTTIERGGKNSSYVYGIYELDNGTRIESSLSALAQYEFKPGETYVFKFRANKIYPDLYTLSSGAALALFISLLTSLVGAIGCLLILTDKYS